MNKLSEKIKEEVEIYFRRNPRISERQLATLSGTSRYFVRTVLNGINFNKKFDLFKLNKLLQITSPNSVVEIINQIDPSFYRKTGIDPKAVIGQLSMRRPVTSGTNDLYEIINDDVEAVIAILSANTGGVSEKTLQKIFGERYKMSVERLMRENVLLPKGKTYHMNFKSFPNLSIRFIKRFIPALLGYYRIGRPVRGRNYITISTGILNIEGMMEMQKAYERFRKELSLISNDEKYRGDIPYFSFGVFDSFLDLYE